MLKTFKWAATILCCLMPALAAAQTPAELTAAMSQDMTKPNRPEGFYTIEAKAPITPKFKVGSSVSRIISSAYNDGKLLAYNMQTVGGWRTVYYLATFDVETGDMTQKEVSSGANALAYDPLKKRYVGYSNQSQSIFEVNPETGEQTKLTQITDIFFNGFAFNASGELFATSSNTESKISLYKLDLENNRTTLIGQTGMSSNNPVRLAFDRKSGNLYAAVSASYGSQVYYYEINTSTGNGNHIDTTESGQQVFALFFTNNTATNEDKAPGLPTDLNVKFKSLGSKSAVLSAKAPVTAIDQTSQLNNPMTLTFFIDDVKVGQKDNVSPGATASIDYTFTSEGVHWMRVETSNTHGTGLNAQTNTFVGIDTPDAVTDAALTIDANGNAKATWKAPVHGANLGQFDASALTYEVKIYPKGEVVATGLKTLSFSAKLPDTHLYNYSYGITPVCGNLRGAETRTNRVEFGKGVRLPFVEAFTSDDTWELHRVIDENKDGTWEKTIRGEVNYCRLSGGKNQAADWLFTPAINMRKGVTYTLDFVVAASFNKTASMNIYLMDKAEVPYGGADAITALTRLTFSDSEYTNGSVTVTPENDGIFRFAFYSNSYPEVPVNLYKYVISASSADDTPSDVSDLKVTPGELGAISAIVSFKAPTTLKNGKQLASNELTAIEIYKGAEKTPVHVFEYPKPGEKLEWTDPDAFHGRNSYVVTCFSDLGNSSGVSANAWVGEDVADRVENLRSYLDEDEGVINISWERPAKGYQDGYLDYDNMTYSLSIFVASAFMEDYITIRTGMTECQTKLALADIRQFLPQEVNGRASVSLLITPYTSAGAGRGCVTGVVLGEAYNLPFAESFSKLRTETDPWSMTTLYGSGAMYAVAQAPKASSLEGLQPQDNDGGMVMFFEQKAEYGEARLLGPKINIGNATDPVLTFYIYHRTAPDTENNWLVVETPDSKGGYIEISQRFPINGFGWQKHEVHLKEMCPADISTIRLVFHGKASGGIDFYFDNFTITDGEIGSQYPRVTDLQASLNAAEDEVTLTWSRPDTGSYTLIGYYIFCDGVRVSNNYTTETTAKVAFPVDGRAHTYAVQALYNEGDALLSNEVTVANSAIAGVDTDSINIFAEGQAVVIEASATPYIIVNTSGVTVATGTAEGRTTVELSSGIYIVKAGTKTAKVVIR